MVKEKEMETSLTLSAVIFGLSARWRLSFPLRGGSSSFLYWPPLERIKNLLFPLFRPSFLLPEQEKIPWEGEFRPKKRSVSWVNSVLRQFWSHGL